MEKELAEKANKILDFLIAGMEKTGEAAKEQFPDIIDQYFTYFLLDSIPIVSTVCFIGFLIAIRSIVKSFKEHGDDESKLFGPIATWALGGFLLLITAGINVGGWVDVAKWVAAPKAALIQALRYGNASGTKTP